ncbi:LysM peptidoglycan-binding domain-containing protein, partial [Acinetobacter baumannii]|uniref:LysM peptidoglycan-binding domain-containing protein n=1 Tax=Acinetobacter baumannii TaxID=470 RepID=UPI001059CC8D
VENQFNLLLKQLTEYNELSVTDGLFVGQKLQLKEPNGTRAAKVEPKAMQASTRRISTKSKTVKHGEYMKLIAYRYAISNQE